ncbi:hypothetical protein HH310_14350 [Actinoplanes sp. TBRC 11911]|uniref:DUF6745 domain-containing protein n=1 Tax=Actinoplanes sp. TBRC 11911 TaxID=2729386 RepID=UPI00145F3014|nr:hypothetical protein [Actinoplanes sp. TBRC 11911]NMO52373.1 hypothetical protein [Actinoplanes sp. TBRC 11911]
MGPGTRTDTDCAAVTDGIRRRYADAGLPWPGRVVWVPSPLAGQLAAADLARRHTPLAGRLRGLGRAARTLAAGALRFGGIAASSTVIMVAVLMYALPGDPWDGRDSGIPADYAREFWIVSLAAGLLTMGLLLWLVAQATIGGEVLAAGVVLLFGPALLAVFGGHIAGAFLTAITGGSGTPSTKWVMTLLTITAVSVVAVAVAAGMATMCRVDPPLLRFTDPAHARLARPGAFADGIDQAVDVTLAWTVRHRHAWALRYPVGRFGGHRHAWWWPHTAFVVVCERPGELHLDGERPHRADGPALAWPDGYHVYASRGVAVPAGLVEDGWDARELHAHPNTEVRRAAIELIGWTEYIDRAGWRLFATAPDPGNAPHELALYEDPSERLRGVRVLVMTNGSPDRHGKPLRYAETVPDTIDDPVEAAAWQYGCPVELYRELRRRT